MTKKIVALCALLSINSFIGANGYPAGQGYEASGNHHGHHGHHGHHHNHGDKIADEADQRRLNTLDELDESAKLYRNISRVGIATGVIAAAGGSLFSKPFNLNMVAGGVATAILSGGANYFINSAEET